MSGRQGGKLKPLKQPKKGPKELSEVLFPLLSLPAWLVP